MKYRLLFLLLPLLALPFRSGAQIQHAPNDTIRLGGVIVGKDTLPMVFMATLEVHEKLPRHLARLREQNSRLKYNIYKVYPYAVIAADLLKDVDVTLARMDGKGDRKAYMKGIEKELNRRFKGELEDLTITQGQILVKLINRQTGKNCFEIIKELKGGFSAVVWQSVAVLFSNSLKREYDPYDRDKDIESIVRDLETNNYYRYRYELQTRR